MSGKTKSSGKRLLSTKYQARESPRKAMRVMAKGQVQRKETSLNQHALLSSLAMQSPPRSHSDQRVVDAIRVAPYLTHVVRHHGQLTLIPPENAGRVRKEKREKSRPRSERPARSNEEPHFNTGVSRSRRGQPASPASRAGRQIGPARRQNSAVGDIVIPDYPPPSFDEAISTAAVPVPAAGEAPAPDSPAGISPTPSSSVIPEIRPPPSPLPIEQGSRGSAVRRSPSPPAAGPSTAHAPRTPSRLAFATPDPGPDPDGPTPSPSVRYSTQAEYNSSEFSDSESNPDSDSSLEFMSIVDAPEGASQWEQDRLLGLPLEERIARENQRQQKRHLSDVASSIFSRAIRPSRSQLTIVPTKHNAELERQEREEELSPSSPSVESPHGISQHRNASPSPARSNKRRLHFFSSGNRKDHEPSSLPSSPTFSSSQLSLPLHSKTYPSSPGSKSTSGQRSEGFISRRLFGNKGKEKEKEPRPEASSSESLTSEPLDSWEVLDQSWQPEANQKQLTGPAASTSAGPSTAVRGRARDDEPVSSNQSRPPPAASSAVAAPSRIPGPVRLKRHSMHDRPAPPPPVPAVAQVQRRRPPPPPPPPHAAPRSPTLPVNTEEDESDAPPATPDNDVPQDMDLQRSLSRQPGDQQPPHELRPSSSMVWVHGREDPTSDSTTRTQPATVLSAVRLPSPVDASRLSPVSTLSAATYIDYNPGSPSTPTPQYFLDADGVLRRGTPIPVSRLQLADPNSPPLPQHGPADGLPHAHAIQHHNSQPNLMQNRVEAVSLEHAARTYSQQYTPLHASQPQVNGAASDRRNGAMHHFSPPNPSPLAGHHRPTVVHSRASPERQAVPASSASDADSPLDLYDQTAVPANAYTPRVQSSPTLSPVAESQERERVDTAGSRHHYPGRPLPQPPGGSSSAGPALPPGVPALPMSDEKLLPLDDDADTQPEAEPPYCESSIAQPPSRAGYSAAAELRAQPTVEAYAVSLPPSPPIQSQEHRYGGPGARMSPPSLSLPAPQSRAPASNGLLQPPTSARSENRMQTPVESSTPSVYEDPRGPTNGYSQYTDLDVLLSRLDDGERGENYENLLLVADIMGPAAEAQARAQRAPSPPVGRVEILRRRTTRDGRVKLKLVLLGVSVDRCGICLSQFKDGQPAALGTQCQHAFHDHCMSRWLVRNQTCPLCRAPFE